MISPSDCNRDDSLLPLKVVRAVLDQGHHLGVELEAYAQFGRMVKIKVFAREVESVTVAEPRGLGVRAMRKGRTGYAFTSDVSTAGIDRVLARAVDNLRAADADPCACLPEVEREAYPEIPGLWRIGVRNTSLDSKIELALEAEAAALAGPDIEVVEESVYSEEEAHIAVASSLGVEAEAEQSVCFNYVMAHAGRDGERQSGLGFCAGREPSELDPAQAGQDAAGKARKLLGARPCSTGIYTVVFDREVAAALLMSIVQALGADAVQKGRSVFAGRLGLAVASPLLNIVDDGLAVDGLATNPFDGEGVPQQATTLIEAGTLRSFLHSTYTARKEGGDCRSSGNAVRNSYRVMPGVGATNVVVKEGRGSLVDLLARVGEGLYVDSVAGLHSGVNPISGEISVGVTGCRIEGGVAGSPVREVTIATDFIQLLQSVGDLGGDARWIPLYGSVCAPSIAVENITVSGV